MLTESKPRPDGRCYVLVTRLGLGPGVVRLRWPFGPPGSPRGAFFFLRNPQTAHAHAGSKFIICISLVYLIPSSKIGNGSRARDKRPALTRTRDRAAI